MVKSEFDRATLVPSQGELRATPVTGGGMTDIAEDDPITLAEACKLFPRAKLTPSTLRAEANKRKRLKIFGMGKRDYTTLRFMREWVRRCQEEDHRSVPATPREVNGSSTERLASAQAALSQTVQVLKKRA
jgi:hypothetical protein